MANNSLVKHSLDDYFQSTPIGSIDKAIGNNLYGINHRQTPGMVPSNKEVYGYTFFTRPQLNMQGDNIRNERRFYPLLTPNELSMQMFVRATLDPRIGAGYKLGPTSIPSLNCRTIDNTQAFIPVLTNSLNSLSGWPDLTAPTFTSESGLFNEAYSMVDGISKYYETFDLDATFRNSKGDPILYMFYIWLNYMSLVFEGKLVPYLDFITENEIDYNTRIYRLVLDKEKNIVTKIAATGAAFPISVPTGGFFDFNSEKPFNDQNRDISIRFKCMGAEYQDDILIQEFNATVSIFQPGMLDANRAANMIKIHKSNLSLFNNRGYARVNPGNNELEWWVTKELYASRTQAFIDSGVSAPLT